MAMSVIQVATLRRDARRQNLTARIAKVTEKWGANLGELPEIDNEMKNLKTRQNYTYLDRDH